MNKKTSLTLLICFILQSLFAQPGKSIPPNASQEFSLKAMTYTNKLRTEKGLPSLKWNEELAQAAQKHSMNMGKGKINFGHKGFKKRINHLKTVPQASAENIFMGNDSGDIARTAVDTWIESPEHLQNLLGNYNACGIGAYQNKKGYWYFTQIFALY